jgi:hypothetical protein
VCVRKFAALCFLALLCSSQVALWADDQEAIKEIEAARSLLTLLDLSLRQREAESIERERLTSEARQAFESEKESLRLDREALTAEKMQFEREKIDLDERKRLTDEREKAFPEMKEQLQKLTDTYEGQLKRLRRSRNLYRASLIVVGGYLATKKVIEIIGDK